MWPDIGVMYFEDRSRSWSMQAASEADEGKEIDSPIKPLEGIQPC